MGCDRWLDAISAEADGEEAGIDPRLVEAHLAGCPSCRAFRDDLAANRTRLRLGAAEPVADLSGRIVKLNAVVDRAGRWGAVRGLLVVIGVQILVLSAPALVLGSESGASAHDARHLGAFSVAYAVGLLVVAVRPARARTMLPVAGVLGLALAVSGVVDMVDGSTGLPGELVHLPELLSVLFVFLLARPAPVRRAPTGLRPVVRRLDDDEDTRAAG